MPNVVCQLCWTTTQAFHELYKKSKVVQENYLNSLVKLELDPFDGEGPISYSDPDTELIPQSNVEVRLLKIDKGKAELAAFQFLV